MSVQERRIDIVNVKSMLTSFNSPILSILTKTSTVILSLVGFTSNADSWSKSPNSCERKLPAALLCSEGRSFTESRYSVEVFFANSFGINIGSDPVSERVIGRKGSMVKVNTTVVKPENVNMTLALDLVIEGKLYFFFE